MKKALLIISTLFLTACAPFPSPPTEEQVSDVPVAEMNMEEIKPKAEVISNALARVTKKPFGIKVSPSDSPVSPERFAGFHTGADFEAFEGEEDADVEIFSICDGPMVLKRTATGYGGVTIQRCVLEGISVTVVYGHLKLDSIEAEVDDFVNKGNKIGILGDGYSKETDGERKHLHLGIHKGNTVNLLGYVQDPDLLNDWIDPVGLME